MSSSSESSTGGHKTPVASSRVPRRLWMDRLLLSRRRNDVLIIDDDADARYVIRSLVSLERFGTIWEAADGESAIAFVYEHHPRLVILDYDMPRMDGETVSRFIRLLSPDSRIIVFTGVLRKAPEWADAYLEKPDVDRLPAVLRSQTWRGAIKAQ